MLDKLDKWERDFRAAARADDYATLRTHLRRLALPNKPKLMLEGTIVVVRMCSAYLTADGYNKAFRQLLGLQTYDPAKASNARYTFTFDIFGKAFARILVATELEPLDLASVKQ